MHKKIKTTNYLQEDAKIHDFPFTPVAWGTKLEGAPKVAEKQYYNASNDIGEKTSQMEEHQKSLLQEFEVYDKTLKALQDQVVNLRCGSLQSTMKVMLRVRDRVVQQVSKFFIMPKFWLRHQAHLSVHLG